MAARLNRRHQSSVREKIRTSQLINRLQDHMLGKLELSMSQVRAATYLIDQAIGTATHQIEHSGAIGQYEAIPVETRDYIPSEAVESAAGAPANGDQATHH